MASTEAAGRNPPSAPLVGRDTVTMTDAACVTVPNDHRSRPRTPQLEIRARKRKRLRRAYRSWRYHNRETHFGWTAGTVALAMLTGVLFVLASLLA